MLKPNDLELFDSSHSFTLSMWFKPSGDKSIMEDNLQNIFALESNIYCYAQKGKITCGQISDTQNSLSVDVVESLDWIHLTFASALKDKQKDGTFRRSYLQLSNNAGEILAFNNMTAAIPLSQ